MITFNCKDDKQLIVKENIVVENSPTVERGFTVKIACDDDFVVDLSTETTITITDTNWNKVLDDVDKGIRVSGSSPDFEAELLAAAEKVTTEQSRKTRFLLILNSIVIRVHKM